jgi:hypothetical protein
MKGFIDFLTGDSLQAMVIIFYRNIKGSAFSRFNKWNN